MRGQTREEVSILNQQSNFEHTSSLPTNVTLWNQNQFKSQAQTGDLIFFHGTTSMGRVIELTGLYSHVAMVIILPDSEKTVLVCEAQQSVGVRCITVERLFTDYWADNKSFGGRAFVFRPRQPLSLVEQDTLYRSAINLMGSLYSNDHIKKMVLRWIDYHLSHHDQRPILEPEYNHLVCSEATLLWFRSINRTLPYDPHYGDYTPSSEAASEDLDVTAELSLPAGLQRDVRAPKYSANELVSCLRAGMPLSNSQEKLQRLSDCDSQLTWRPSVNNHGLFAAPRRLRFDSSSDALQSRRVDSSMLVTLGSALTLCLAVAAVIKKGWRCQSRRSQVSTHNVSTQFSSVK
jgi:hypothetical protein